MNKKLFVLSIPTLLSPYIAIFTLAVVFLSTKVKLFEAIMESIFQNDGLLLIATLIIYLLLTIALGIACFFISTFKFRDALSTAKTAMLIKLIQIPAYIMIFVLGVAMTIAIWTIPFTIALFWIDCLCLFLTSLPVISSIICAVRHGTMKFQEVIWVIILQFVFCADVVASIIYYKKLKKSANAAEEIPAELVESD